MTSNYDLNETTKFLRKIWSPGARELRILYPSGHVWSGVYTDPAIMARHAAYVCANTSPAGVYYGLGGIGLAHIPHIAAGAPNKLQKRPKHAVKAQHISYSGLIMVDIDSVHPPGVCATAAEKAEAAKVKDDVITYLTKTIDFPEPIVHDTGNGYHLLWPSSCAPGHSSWRYMLQWLARTFDTDGAKIDTSVADAARIARLPGSVNAKGSDTAERPHRLCKIVSYPEQLRGPRPIYTIAQSHGYTAQYDREAAYLRQREEGDLPELVLDEEGMTRLVAEYPDHLEVYRTSRKDGRTFFYLCSCPFNGRPHRDQRAGKTVIILGDDAVGFKCFSADCANHTFQELLALLQRQTGHKHQTPIYAAASYENLHKLYPIWGGVDDVNRIERKAARKAEQEAQRDKEIEREEAEVDQVMQDEANAWVTRMRIEDEEFRYEYESHKVERSGVLAGLSTDPRDWDMEFDEVIEHFIRVRKELGYEPIVTKKYIGDTEVTQYNYTGLPHRIAEPNHVGHIDALLEMGRFLGVERLWHIYRDKRRPVMGNIPAPAWDRAETEWVIGNVNPLYNPLKNKISDFDYPLPHRSPALLKDLF